MDTEVNASDLPKTLWVEATAVSASLRDIHLTLGHEPPGRAELIDDLDRVKATAIWVDHDPAGTLSTAGAVIWPAASNELKSFKNDYIKQFGTYYNDLNTEMGAAFGIGLEFRVKPKGAGPGGHFGDWGGALWGNRAHRAGGHFGD